MTKEQLQKDAEWHYPGPNSMSSMREDYANVTGREAYQEGFVKALHLIKARAEELPDSLHDWLLAPFQELL